jgi:hypothetical protein
VVFLGFVCRYNTSVEEGEEIGLLAMVNVEEIGLLLICLCCLSFFNLLGLK